MIVVAGLVRVGWRVILHRGAPGRVALAANGNFVSVTRPHRIWGADTPVPAGAERVESCSVSGNCGLRLPDGSGYGHEGDAGADGCREADQGVARRVTEAAFDAGDFRLLD